MKTSKFLSRILYLSFAFFIALLAFPVSYAAAQTVKSAWTFSAWSGGYTANLVITNTGTIAITNWTATFTTPQAETSVWNATITGPVNNVYMLTPASWTAAIPANGGNITIGFTFNGTPPQTPTNFTFQGQLASGSSGSGSTGSGSGSSGSGSTGSGSSGSGSTGSGSTGSGSSGSGSSGSGGVAGTSGASGTINFHYYYGVSPTTPEDSLNLTGGNYTDLIMSNMIAGVMYGHLLNEFTPGIQFNKDYLYGSIFAQLLQENIATEYYQSSSNLLDPSSDQQAVFGTGQGGPYQINNYAADMVAGTYAPAGFSLINFNALQKNIGYTMANAGQQYKLPTPASFNNKYFGPMLTAYFHYNDYRALQYIGGNSLTQPWSANSHSWTPQWQPSFDQSVNAFKGLPGNQLEILLNVAYNAGYYASLFQTDSQDSAGSTAQTVADFNSFSNAWGGDSYHQYPYQVRGYLDQLYDTASPTSTNLNTLVTTANHVPFLMSTLSTVFSNVFQTLAYVNSSKQYVSITNAQAVTAFNAALASNSLTSTSTLDLSKATDRAVIFTVIDNSITNLEKNLNTSFSATSLTQL
jgi:hypothetical protein